MNGEEFGMRVQAKRKELYLAALSVVRNAEDADDAVSEAVTAAWENLHKLKDDGKFDMWMLKILYNTAKDIYRKNRAYADIKELSEAFTYDPDIENIEFFDIICRCGFDGKTLKILILRFVYGYSLQEIAEGTGMSVSTVKTKYYRALKKLSMTEGLR